MTRSAAQKPTILITGANGFVGGWFVEALHLSGSWTVRAGISRWSGAARIARFPVEISRCDIMDKAELDDALSGVEVVVHCARGREDDSPVTTEGTRLLLERARRAGVRKVVFMSSVAVYGDATGDVHESSAPQGVVTTYGATKIRAEEICREMADDAMSVVVLRPTLIYGPFSEQWTMPYIARLASRKWRHLGPLGDGSCNLVYVGDLVHFVQHLVAHDTGAYAVFNANGPEVPTWNSYIGRFNAALGFPALDAAPRSNARLRWQVALRRPVRRAGKYMLANHRDALVSLSARSARLRTIMRKTEADLRLKPNDDEIRRFATDVRYSMNAAQAIGFAPPTTVDRGLLLTAGWARDMGLLA